MLSHLSLFQPRAGAAPWLVCAPTGHNRALLCFAQGHDRLLAAKGALSKRAVSLHPISFFKRTLTLVLAELAELAEARGSPSSAGVAGSLPTSSASSPTASGVPGTLQA
eukprot:78636-Prymnesium_polylepis.1